MNRAPRLLVALLLSAPLGCGGERPDGGETPWSRITVERLTLPDGYSFVADLSDDGRTMALRFKPGRTGVLDQGSLQEFAIEGTGDLIQVSPNGRFAVGYSTASPYGTYADWNLLFWERGKGMRTIATRRCYGMGTSSVANDGSVVADYRPYSSLLFRRTIRFRLPDVVEESDGPPPNPPIPIVAPPGYSEPVAVFFSDNGRFAAGHVSDAERHWRPCLWDATATTNHPPLPETDRPWEGGAYFVSDDGKRTMYSVRFLDPDYDRDNYVWIEGRPLLRVADLLRKAGEPEWDDPLWGPGVYSPNGRYFTLSRGNGDFYMVHAP